MTNKTTIPWDKQGSRYKLTIYFYRQDKSQYKQDFYSKIIGKPEPPDSFLTLRAKAHKWRGNNYGYSAAIIYHNLKEGKPRIIQIDSQGREFPQDFSQLDTK